MNNNIELHVTGAPEEVRSRLEQTLQNHGYRFTWDTPSQGKVEKGSRVKGLILGFLSPHYKYKVMLDPQQDGSVVIKMAIPTVSVHAASLSAGLRVSDELGSVKQSLAAAFQSAGALIAS